MYVKINLIDNIAHSKNSWDNTKSHGNQFKIKVYRSLGFSLRKSPGFGLRMIKKSFLTGLVLSKEISKLRRM